MARENYNDLVAFLAVARERSFTRAAAKLGVSQSALSHTVRGLEERLGLRLLTRTTRSVSATEAGQQLIDSLSPSFEQIESAIAAVGELRDRPSGTIRITTSAHAARHRLWPVLSALLEAHPDIKAEVVSDSMLVDIAADGFDAGIRLGEQIAKDMVAVRIGPPLRMAAVASPAYLKGHPRVEVPQDLIQHDCINLRFLTRGNLYAWEFEKDGHPLNVGVDGRLTFNAPDQIVQAAIEGFGIAFLPDDIVAAELGDGRLTRLLADWCPPFPGYHLYYPSRRQHSAAFALLVEALRERSDTP